MNIALNDLHQWAGEPLSEWSKTKSVNLVFQVGAYSSRADGWLEVHRPGVGLEIIVANLRLTEHFYLVLDHHQPCVWFLITPNLSNSGKTPVLGSAETPTALYPGLNTLGIKPPGRVRLFLGAQNPHLFIKVSIDLDRLNSMAQNCAATFISTRALERLQLNNLDMTMRWRISPRLDCIASQALTCGHYQKGKARALFMEAKALEIIDQEISDLFHRPTISSDNVNLRETHEMNKARRFLCAYAGLSPKLFGESETLKRTAEALKDFYDEASRSRTDLAALEKKALQEARLILEQEFVSPPSLIELARRAGTNEFKLKRGFRKLFGTTVFGYIRELRMKKARCLLEQGHLNVTEVAFEVGYSSLGHFSASFRQRFGALPSRYRACYKETVLAYDTI